MARARKAVFEYPPCVVTRTILYVFSQALQPASQPWLLAFPLHSYLTRDFSSHALDVLFPVRAATPVHVIRRALAVKVPRQ